MFARRPVSKPPTIPPIVWIPKASKESSMSKEFLIFTPEQQLAPGTMPITKAPLGVTNPAAGVIPTNPARNPEEVQEVKREVRERNGSLTIHDSIDTGFAFLEVINGHPSKGCEGTSDKNYCRSQQ
jgi:hypothetical protein